MPPTTWLHCLKKDGAANAYGAMVIKERRIKCAARGERDTVVRGERGPVTAYCDTCREERKREQARARMQALRARCGP